MGGVRGERGASSSPTSSASSASSTCSPSLELPTHGLADEALYLSHMAVDGEYRRQRPRLLRAAEARAVDAGAEAIYLHVERSNEAALQLTAEEYNTLPESPVYTSFTSAPSCSTGSRCCCENRS